jgi:hypothetical protein
MKIVANQKLIKRNAFIGQATNILGLVAVGISIYLFLTTSKTGLESQQFYILITAVILSLIFTQISIYFMDRWGRKPRPDETIDKSLKGLGREYTIYHYVTPASHLLVGPAGIWALVAYYQAGTVIYERKRWRMRGGGFIQGYLRIFGQGSIGRPDLEAESEISLTKRYLEHKTNGVEAPVQAALLFINPRVKIEAENAPLPAFAPKDLKDFMRQRAKEKPLTPLTLETIRQALPKPTGEEE